jgi:predicted O-linked N-acetylglucosamine transferase (SPINDLY family)
VRERFEAWGVDPARIELRGSSPWASMMREYSQLDAVLDSFPYNGGVTTLEALWMGRPVLTIRGDSMISRQSAAILECIGRREWIAGDRGEFVENAVRLASMPQKLAEACGVLRTEMAASPVVDVRGFTRELESAYRRCWRSLQV